MTLLSLLLSARAATVSPASVPAAAPAEALVTVTEFGRYTVTAESALSASITLVDRMAGPLPARDGRIDVFLDRGEHRLRLQGAASDTGDIALSITPSVEQERAPKALPDGSVLSSVLRDHEHRSYWLHVTEPEALQVEVAGRYLVDLRLWQDGTWLHGAQPSCREVAPVEGRPLRDCTLETRLEPGLYRLTAYGGAGLDWTDGSEEAPLHLRRGVPALGDIGEQSLTISPFGVDRFRVEAPYVHLALPAVAPVRLSAWDASRGPYSSGTAAATIDTESRRPVAALDLRRQRARFVAVEGTAGQPYTLQHFTPTPATVRLAPSESASWVSTLSAGVVTDQLDLTALLIRETDAEAVVEAASGIPLRADVRYARRVNLPDRPVTLLLDVAAEGVWRFELGELDGQIQVAPLLLRPPPEHEPPPLKRGPQEITLAAGLYVLAIVPDKPGIASIDVRPVRGADALPVTPHLTAAQFPQVDTSDPAQPINLFMLGDPTVRRGLIQRPLPLDLSQPLAVTLPPQATIDLPLDVTEQAGLVVDGAAGVVEVRLDREVFPRGGQVWPMRHDLRLTNATDAPQSVVARLVPPERALPTLPDAARAALPDFPEIRAGEALPLDLDAGAQATATLRVDAPGLYAVTSEGLLSVQATLRTRTIPRLDVQAQNGPGRNAQLQQYLREGEYQVTAQTLGRSAGHLRLRLAQTALRDGGTLQLDRPARVGLSAGEGVVYQLDIPRDGRFTIRSSAEGAVPRCRLEDADGWPVVAPNQPADLSLMLSAGQYRLVLLPSAVDERRMTTLSEVTPELSREGHGPHPLSLDTPTPHRWREPQDGGPRLPDLWTFSLAAPAEVSATLSEGMVGQLFRDNTLLDSLSGELPAGDYQLSVRSSRPDHGRAYTVAVRATELTAGHSRPCTAPCVIPISADGLTEVSTSGEQDVRLRLSDGDRLLAESDDRPGGWDALLLEDLPAGRYTLVVSPVGAARAQTTVSMRQPPLRPAEPLSAGRSVTLSPGDGVLDVPIDAPSGGVLLAEAQADESIGLAVVQGDRVLSSDSGEAARVGAWLSTDAPAYLRVWSVDRRGGPVTVTLAQTTPAPRPAGTIEATVLAGQAVARVATPRGGAFRVSSAGEVCTAPGRPCAPLDGLAATDGDSLVVIVPATAGAPSMPVTVAEDVLPTDRWSRIVVPAAGARWAVTSGEGPLLVIAQTNHGQPGLRLTDPAAPVSAAGERLAVAAHASLSSPTIALWPADGAERLPARVRAWRFEPPRSDRLSVGAQDVPVPAGAAARRVLARPGPVTVALPAGLAAVVDTGGDGGGHVYYADGAAEVIAVDRARSVLLLNPTDRDDIARLVALPEGVEEAFLQPGTPLEQSLAHRQRQRLRIPLLDGDPVVHAAGAIEGMTWLGADGAVARTDGSTLALGASGGWLEVSALPGTSVLWLGEDGLVAADGATGAVALPVRLALSGTSTRLAVRGEAGAVLQVEITAPSVVAVATGGREVAEVLLQGGAVDVPLAEGGQAVVSVRALAGGTLRGALSLQAAEPIPLDDGVGEPVALSPGERRWFSVILSGEQELGVGVQSSSDRVNVVLTDDDGVPLGEGRVQLHTLPAGRYLLGLSLPADARPATARPALVGGTPRGAGPPEEIIRAYVEGGR